MAEIAPWSEKDEKRELAEKTIRNVFGKDIFGSGSTSKAGGGNGGSNSMNGKHSPNHSAAKSKGRKSKGKSSRSPIRNAHNPGDLGVAQGEIGSSGVASAASAGNSDNVAGTTTTGKKSDGAAKAANAVEAGGISSEGSKQEGSTSNRQGGESSPTSIRKQKTAVVADNKRARKYSTKDFLEVHSTDPAALFNVNIKSKPPNEAQIAAMVYDVTVYNNKRGESRAKQESILNSAFSNNAKFAGYHKALATTTDGNEFIFSPWTPGPVLHGHALLSSQKLTSELDENNRIKTTEGSGKEGKPVVPSSPDKNVINTTTISAGGIPTATIPAPPTSSVKDLTEYLFLGKKPAIKNSKDVVGIQRKDAASYLKTTSGNLKLKVKAQDWFVSKLEEMGGDMNPFPLKPETSGNSGNNDQQQPHLRIKSGDLIYALSYQPRVVNGASSLHGSIDMTQSVFMIKKTPVRYDQEKARFRQTTAERLQSRGAPYTPFPRDPNEALHQQSAVSTPYHHSAFDPASVLPVATPRTRQGHFRPHKITDIATKSENALYTYWDVWTPSNLRTKTAMTDRNNLSTRNGDDTTSVNHHSKGLKTQSSSTGSLLFPPVKDASSRDLKITTPLSKNNNGNNLVGTYTATATTAVSGVERSDSHFLPKVDGILAVTAPEVHVGYINADMGGIRSDGGEKIVESSSVGGAEARQEQQPTLSSIFPAIDSAAPPSSAPPPVEEEAGKTQEAERQQQQQPDGEETTEVAKIVQQDVTYFKDENGYPSSTASPDAAAVITNSIISNDPTFLKKNPDGDSTEEVANDGIIWETSRTLDAGPTRSESLMTTSQLMMAKPSYISKLLEEQERIAVATSSSLMLGKHVPKLPSLPQTHPVHKEFVPRKKSKKHAQYRKNRIQAALSREYEVNVQTDEKGNAK